MRDEFHIGDQVEMTFEMQSVSTGGVLWPTGSKGVVEKVGAEEVTIRMRKSDLFKNVAFVAPMDVMRGVFRKLSDFN